MARNTFGTLLTFTSFGESHGSMIGGVLDGFPSNYYIDDGMIIEELKRRSSANNIYSTPRKEDDELQIVSGIYKGKSTGAPIAFLIRNTAALPADYDKLAGIHRPSHGSFSYEKKYGNFDPSGGGRSSARETVVRVVAGAICKQLIATKGVAIKGFVSQIGPVKCEKHYTDLELENADSFSLRCPDYNTNLRMEQYLDEIKQQGDSAGGVVTCVISGLPAGVGEPLFNKLQSVLSTAMMSINAVKGFEYGEGFASASMKGSQHNDTYKYDNNKVAPASNHAGGILAGISTGENVFFNVAFKPVSSIAKKQQTVDNHGNRIQLNIGGRHDVCVVPRAVPIVEAMAALSIADLMLMGGFIQNNV